MRHVPGIRVRTVQGRRVEGCRVYGARRGTYLGAGPVLAAAPGCSPSRHPPQGCTGCCGKRGPAYAALATAPTDSTATHTCKPPHTVHLTKSSLSDTLAARDLTSARTHTPHPATAEHAPPCPLRHSRTVQRAPCVALVEEGGTVPPRNVRCSRKLSK